jgi:hypothetical protein
MQGPTEELWRDIPGCPGYQVSNLGRVKGVLGKELRQRLSSSQNAVVVTVRVREGRRQPKSVHRLVGEAFIGPLSAGLQTCHNDGNLFNNSLGNLRYDTKAANESDKKRHGTANIGERNGRAKLTSDDVRVIRQTRASSYEIAKQFGVSRQTVCHIRSGLLWRHA